MNRRMKITPVYTFETTPPKVIVVPAQNGRSEATLEWIRESTNSTHVTMSVCIGAFLLAHTGLEATPEKFIKAS
jgi:transcriptional regulator GlxA family with amidase domain